MLKLKSIEIKGIWGYRTIKTDFREDTNIFIGNNGTGKTAFLNIIEAILTVDLEQIYLSVFNEVTIYMGGDNNSRKLNIIKKMYSFNGFVIEYKVGRRKFTIPFVRDLDFRNTSRVHPQIRDILKALKEELAIFLNICWLSVYREIPTPEDNDYSANRDTKVKNTIDQRLYDLMRRLTVYQLQLESEASKLSSEFKELVFESMLYKPEFDEINLQNLKPVNPEDIKRKLNKAYKDLGMSSRETLDKITTHTNKIGLAISKIEKWKADNSAGLLVNDVTPLSLLNRTLSIIEISTRIEVKKKEIFKPIDTYLRILKDFVPEKTFKLDTESSGELTVFCYKTKENETTIPSPAPAPSPLPIKFLSSGEKQLIILLTETLLQKNAGYIFIADEPELSLHISWQRKILSAIRELNENAQIIVATHSPEIAGQWRDNIINMENISSNG
jgi:predicted ATP-dependent endonuclease of OLD family